MNGKFYIGSHQAKDLNDSYLGSGRILKLALKKYGRSNFVRSIIAVCESFEVMRSIETQMVKYSIDNFGREYCYNRSYSGTGAMLGEDNGFYGKQHTEKTRSIISEKAKLRSGELNHFYGRHHTEETKDKLRARNINFETCENMAAYYWKKTQYWYCTPIGCFISTNAASLFCGLSKSCISDRCSSENEVVRPCYQIPEEYWNKTWRENGFYRINK